MKFNKETIIEFESYLISRGYKKYNQKNNNSDYTFWKSFGVSRDASGEKFIQYQIGVLIYDFSKYPQHTDVNPISCSLEFNLCDNSFASRADLIVSDEQMTLNEFEDFSLDLYEKMFAKTNITKSQ